jgi:hypothetical protein
MNAFTLVVLSALVWWAVRAGLRRRRAARQRGDFSSYRSGDAALDWALALAHPMAFHAIQGGFADRQLHGADDALTTQLRPMVLHHLGLRTDLDDAQIARQLPDGLCLRARGLPRAMCLAAGLAGRGPAPADPSPERMPRAGLL